MSRVKHEAITTHIITQLESNVALIASALRTGQWDEDLLMDAFTRLPQLLDASARRLREIQEDGINA